MEASPWDETNFSKSKANSDASNPFLKFYFTRYDRVLFVDALH
jgi:hypothetical protein